MALPEPSAVSAMKVAELKGHLTALSLSTKGKKAELAARLLEALQAKAAAVAIDAAAVSEKPAVVSPPSKPAAAEEPAVVSPPSKPAAEPAAPTPAPSAGAAKASSDATVAKPSEPVERRADGRKKKKKKKKIHVQPEELQKKRETAAADTSEQSDVVDPKNAVTIEYVTEEAPELANDDPSMAEFAAIFAKFKPAEAAEESKPSEREEASEGAKGDDGANKEAIEESSDEEEVERLSKKKLRKLNRFSVAALKQLVDRPDVVEIHDVTAADPRLLVHLKATRNTVAVPRHWCHKRKYLQGKRGIEKPPFDLPEYIKRTGIMEIREALAEKEEAQNLKAKLREKMRPKTGKIDIDYQKLHDAFFRWQTKPRMTIHGDIYYESKEHETRMTDRKPGDLSTELKEALGMPTEPDAPPMPPPWLLHMQRHGPPPSYPNLKIPGLSAPLPPGAGFGFHAGGWGKAPVDELGRPLYGDVFGASNAQMDIHVDAQVDKSLWGQLESEDSGESSSEEEEGDSSGDEAAGEGLETPSGLSSVISEAPSGISSVGMETPDAIELRKRRVIEDAMDNSGESQSLYKIIPERAAHVGAAMMGSSHVYDVNAAAVPMANLVKDSGAAGAAAGGVDLAVDNPEMLSGLDQDTLAARYEQGRREAAGDREDLSDMVAEHQARAKLKRKKDADKKDKGKKFKF